MKLAVAILRTLSLVGVLLTVYLSYYKPTEPVSLPIVLYMTISFLYLIWDMLYLTPDKKKNPYDNN